VEKRGKKKRELCRGHSSNHFREKGNSLSKKNAENPAFGSASFRRGGKGKKEKEKGGEILQKKKGEKRKGAN